MLGRGRYAVVTVSERSDTVAVKTIETDDQRPPHNWKAEIAALERLNDVPHVIRMLRWSAALQATEPHVCIEMPRYNLTLEHVIYHYAKASYPPGSGWRNTMPRDRIADIVAGIAAGLEATHALGIIHRDLKPENILFETPESIPILIDFGISWVPHVSETKERPGDRITDVSSAEYKAPELLFGIRHYTEMIDLWAFGCILGRLLTSNCTPIFAPYTSDMALVAAHLKGLGAPNVTECPSLAGSVAESLASVGTTDRGASQPVTALFRKLENGDNLVNLALRLLNYEWTARPSAAEVHIIALNK